MKTLLTGATGFVGAAVLRRLIEAGHNFLALVRPNSDRRNLSGLECETITGDLAEPQSLSRRQPDDSLSKLRRAEWQPMSIPGSTWSTSTMSRRKNG